MAAHTAKRQESVRWLRSSTPKKRIQTLRLINMHVNNMAERHGFFGSLSNSDFRLEDVDVNVLKLLSNELNFTYDGNRIKWTDDLDSLKLFVENVIGLTGVWRSPGGYAKQFKSTTFDFILNWYPGKLNTILFHGKDGERFKQVLLTVLNIHCIGEGDAILNASSLSTAEPENPNNNTSIFDRESGNCSCKCSKEDMENIKLDIEILQSRIDCLQSLANSCEYRPFTDTNERLNSEVISLQVIIIIIIIIKWFISTLSHSVVNYNVFT